MLCHQGSFKVRFVLICINIFSRHAVDEQIFENNFSKSDVVLLVYRFIFFNVDFRQDDGNK